MGEGNTVVLFGEVDAVGVEICGCRPWGGVLGIKNRRELGREEDWQDEERAKQKILQA